MPAMKMNRRVLILAFPVIVLFLLFHVFPVVMAGDYSFVNNPFDRVFSGIGNYLEVLHNKYFQLAFRNTAICSPTRWRTIPFCNSSPTQSIMKKAPIVSTARNSAP